MERQVRVEVYKNLRNGLWSVRSTATGRVIDHRSHLYVTDAKLVVQPAGNARVRATGRKNVHAFVRGELVEGLSLSDLLDQLHPNPVIAERVTYNPYENTTFVTHYGNKPVHRADVVRLGVHVYAWLKEIA